MKLFKSEIVKLVSIFSSQIMKYIANRISSIPGKLHHIFNEFGLPITQNDRQIVTLKDAHKGKRAFIIGMGPSLHTSDLDLLKNEITFGCNKVYLAFRDTDWRPTYYTVLDVLVAQNNHDIINKLNLVKIFPLDVKSYFQSADDVIWIRALPYKKGELEKQFKFSTDMLKGVYGGWTVIYTMLQIAYYMGIKKLYLLGIDFSFDIPKVTNVKCSQGPVLESGDEINHFHPEYRKPGETWTMPKLDLQKKAFRCARETLEMDGGFIVNASRKTALDVFPRAELEHILSSET